MKKLSILIPTYNRQERLKKTFPEIISNKSDDIEFVVVDNDSIDNTEKYIKQFIKLDERIKYFKNYTNIGPNRTIYRALLESSSEWVVIIPDDDYIPPSFIDELLEQINLNEEYGIIITAKDGQPSLCKDSKVLKGYDALRAAYLHSSSITGIAWNKKHINEKGWLLDGNIYPQVRVSLDIALITDVLYFVPKNQPKILTWKKDKLFSLGRPKDFGFFELINILDEFYYKINIEDKLSFYYKASASKFTWVINLYNELYIEDKSKSKAFLKNLVTHKSIGSSAVFWVILFKYINTINLKLFFMLGYIFFRRIFFSLLNNNLYISSFYLINNMNYFLKKSLKSNES